MPVNLDTPEEIGRSIRNTFPNSLGFGYIQKVYLFRGVRVFNERKEIEEVLLDSYRRSKALACVRGGNYVVPRGNHDFFTVNPKALVFID